MSREILFRGKILFDDSTISRWIEGSLTIVDGKNFIILPESSEDDCDGSQCVGMGLDNLNLCLSNITIEVNPETVGQYTGFNEFNKPDGEKLFDNDVVYIAGFGNYVVQWPYLELIGLELIDSAAGDIGKKLGNIIDNPELLEVGE